MAVLRLDRPVRYAPHIAPICLPEVGRDPAPGTQAYVAGWGALIPEDVTGPLISILVPEVRESTPTKSQLISKYSFGRLQISQKTMEFGIP